MSGLLNALFGTTKGQTPPVRQSATLHDPLERLVLDPSADAQCKKTEQVRVDFFAQNWSQDIELPLFKLNVIPQTHKKEIITAGGTHMRAARHFYETSKGETCSSSSFRTSARVEGAYATEVIISKEEDGAIPGIYTDLMLMTMELGGEPQEAIDAQAKINKEYQAQHRHALKSKENVFSDRICHLTESVKVYIDVHDKKDNPKIEKDHALITVVSAKTEKIIAQNILVLEKPQI